MGWRGAAADFLKQGYNGRGGGLFKYMDGQVPGSGHTPSPLPRPPRPPHLRPPTFRIRSWILIHPVCTIPSSLLLLKYRAQRESSSRLRPLS